MKRRVIAIAVVVAVCSFSTSLWMKNAEGPSTKDVLAAEQAVIDELRVDLGDLVEEESTLGIIAALRRAGMLAFRRLARGSAGQVLQRFSITGPPRLAGRWQVAPAFHGPHQPYPDRAATGP